MTRGMREVVGSQGWGRPSWAYRPRAEVRDARGMAAPAWKDVLAGRCAVVWDQARAYSA